MKTRKNVLAQGFEIGRWVKEFHKDRADCLSGRVGAHDESRVVVEVDEGNSVSEGSGNGPVHSYPGGLTFR